MSFASDLEKAVAPPALSEQARQLGIGVVGCGSIVRAAHLPAYRKAGLNVVAVVDRDEARSAGVAEQFGIGRTYASVAEMLANPAIAVLDIAVDPESQADIAAAAIARGKHLLCQKPFSESFSTATTLVERAESAGVLLAVNQQMRWEQLVRGIKFLIDNGALGTIYDVFIDIDVRTDFASWPLMAPRPRLELFYHSIHHLDSLRFLMGECVDVSASLSRHPLQTIPGETRSLVHLRYAEGATASIRTDHNNWSDDPRALIHVRGTEGSIDGELGLLYDYPNGRPDRLVLRRKDGTVEHHEFSGSWVPDAFVASMSDLLGAIDGLREPSASGRDNLETLRLVHAAYLSNERGTRVDCGGFTPDESEPPA
ncbi:gfo/Idh/MocA family oxidoreductase [Nakamurella antarctica]|uniref:Gfo/Idh/MocA family oxidoreductase n=1 Tax=Nakamurella antarctica TaxID=1902245 RepID=A0A3G8ZHU1_9ACTN|nr:Gfo/Idh/MocA family oxidoreductase [Nakamurella antarctica]AZI56929.1 gfo/Idh/MocA family oxidoreductase [Nakamurella antarctica]